MPSIFTPKEAFGGATIWIINLNTISMGTFVKHKNSQKCIGKIRI